MLVIKLSTSPAVTQETVKAHMEANFQGECVPFCDENLRAMTDLQRVRKIYKLNAPVPNASRRIEVHSDNSMNVRTEDEAAIGKELEMSILGSMALRGAS